MNIQVLGAHNSETLRSRFVTLLVDDVIAIDAGGLTGALPFREQLKLKVILLTHQHYDHLRDVPAIAMNFFMHQQTINIYSNQAVYDALTKHLLDGELYPNFLERPAENPTIKYTIVEPDKTEKIEGYSIMPVMVNHPVPTVGYQVTSPDDKVMLYTSDTDGGLGECWKRVSPKLLFIEVTAPDRLEGAMREAGHLTPRLLKQELISFLNLKGYLPTVYTVHMNPMYEDEIRIEIAHVAAELRCRMRVAREGMRLRL